MERAIVIVKDMLLELYRRKENVRKDTKLAEKTEHKIELAEKILEELMKEI